MKHSNKEIQKPDRRKKSPNNDRGAFAERLREESFTFMKTIVDTVREPFLILDKDLYVLAANESFYKTFQVSQEDTENKLVYELGNRQWDIPALQKLLEEVLLHDTFFKGFEVSHDFPEIGQKVMILNARRIYRRENNASSFPPIIFLAMEDVTEIMEVADMLTKHASEFEDKMTNRTKELETRIKELEKQISDLEYR